MGLVGSLYLGITLSRRDNRLRYAPLQVQCRCYDRVQLKFLLGFSTSVSVYGLEGSTGFDLLGGSTGSNLLNPLPVFIQFDDSMFLVLGLDR